MFEHKTTQRSLQSDSSFVLSLHTSLSSNLSSFASSVIRLEDLHVYGNDGPTRKISLGLLQLHLYTNLLENVGFLH